MSMHIQFACDRCGAKSSFVVRYGEPRKEVLCILTKNGWVSINEFSHICPGCQETKYKVAIKTPPVAGGTQAEMHYSRKTLDTSMGAEEEIRIMKLTLPESLWKDWEFEWTPVKE